MADVSFTWPGVQQTLDHEGWGNVLVPQSLHLSDGMITLLPWACTRALLVSCKMLPCVELLLSLCRKVEIRVQKKKSKQPISALGAVAAKDCCQPCGRGKMRESVPPCTSHFGESHLLYCSQHRPLTQFPGWGCGEATFWGGGLGSGGEPPFES